MIDFHSHILPGIDDGAQDAGQTFTMLEEAKQAGFSKIIVTPHYIENCYEIEADSVEKVLQAISSHTAVSLYHGQEAYASMNLNLFLAERKIVTIANSHYLLLEFPMNVKPIWMEEALYHLQEKNIIPIIAHPERYSYVQDEPNMLWDLVQRGILFQSNYGSIIGVYGKKAKRTLEKLLTHHYIHFLGTDCHRPHSIYKKMPEILKELHGLISEKECQSLVATNAEKVLKDEELEVDLPEKIKFFW